MTLLKEVQEQLVTLSLNHAARNLGSIIEKANTEDWTTLKIVHTLLLAEKNARADKARQKRLKQACFPYTATLEKFDFGFQASVSKEANVPAAGVYLAGKRL